MRSTTPPGWYPDWDDPDQQRYWNGTQWTDHAMPHPKETADASSAGSANASMPPNTLWLAVGGAALLVAGIAIGAVAAGGDDEGGSPSSSPTVTVTAAPHDSPTPVDRPSLRFPKQDGDWQLESLQVTDDDGNFVAGGDLTYSGTDEPSGDHEFTVTLYNNAGAVVATLSGSVTEVAPGETVTTDFSGSDPYRPGNFPSTFQVDE
jgi:hypothetical protein